MVALAQVLGNLGADPEMKFTPQGTKNVELRVITNIWIPGRNGEQGQSVPNAYRATIWGRDADRAEKMMQDGKLVKGAEVIVSGQLEVRTFTRQDGTQGYSLDIRNATWEPTRSTYSAQTAPGAREGGQQAPPYAQGPQNAPQGQYGPPGSYPPGSGERDREQRGWQAPPYESYDHPVGQQQQFDRNQYQAPPRSPYDDMG